MANENFPAHKLTLSRPFAATPAALFDAWLDPNTIGRFLFRTPGGVLESVEVEANVGGAFTIVEKRGEMTAPHYGTFRVIERPKRIVFGFAVAREQPPSEVTVEIAKAGEGALVTLTHAIDPKWAEYAPMILAGWSRMLASLSALLAMEAGQVLQTSRIISAPRKNVWQAWTEPEALARWWGGKEAERPEVEAMDVKPGGGFRLRIAAPGRPVFTIRGTYREVEADTRLVYDDVCEADGKPFYEEVLEADFAAAGKGKTRVTVTAPLAPAMGKQSQAVLDELRIGWARGWADNLDALAAELEAKSGAT